jgi:hypothetical protein
MEKNKLSLFKDWLPLILLVVFNLYGWTVVVLDDSITYTNEEIIVSISILVLLLLYFNAILSNWRIFFLGIILFLWAFTALQVCHNVTVHTYTIRLGSVKLSTPPIDFRGLFVLAVYVLAYKKYLLKILAVLLELIDGKRSITSLFH